MATTTEAAHALARKNQFQQIDDIIAMAAQEFRGQVVVCLDIDGVQEGARAALEKKLFNHFKDNPFFAQWFEHECFLKLLEILDKFTFDGTDFPLRRFSFEGKIKELLSYSQEERDVVFKTIASSHTLYTLIFLNLQKKLAENKEEDTPEKIKIYLQTKTAFVCAMQLSAAMCIDDDLILGESGEEARRALEQLYQKYQHKEGNRFVLLNLTSRTPAMAHVFKLQLDKTFGEANIYSLERQQLAYNHNEKLLRDYPTCAAGNVIAASRHKKYKVAYSFLLQNNLLTNLEAAPLSIVFVDDKREYLEDMQQLPEHYAKQTGGNKNHIQVTPFHFSYNENAFSDYVNKKFNISAAHLSEKIEDYLKIIQEVEDPDAKEVVLHYVRPLFHYLASQVSSTPMNSFGAARPLPPTLSNAPDRFLSQVSELPTKNQKLDEEKQLTITPSF